MPNPERAQEWLIDRMQITGYKSNRRGVCSGVAHMAKHAILSQNTRGFFHRLAKIKATPLEKFSELGKESKFLQTHVHPLFNGIELYQNSHLFSEFFSEQFTTIYELNSHISALTKPSILGEIVCPVNFGGIYDQEELISYFDLFQATFKNEGCTQPVALILSNIEHAIAVGYNPGRKKAKWQLFDANQLSENGWMSSKKIGKKVFNIFNEVKYAIISTQVYVEAKAGKLPDQCYGSLLKQKKWKTIHDIDIKFHYPELNYSRILTWSSTLSNSKYLESLLTNTLAMENKHQRTAAISYKLWSGARILLMVIIQHPHLVTLLLNIIASLENEMISAEFFEATIEGSDPFQFAIVFHPQLLTTLIEFIIKFSQPLQVKILRQKGTDGMNPLMAAVMHRREACVNSLLDLIYTLRDKEEIYGILRECDHWSGGSVLILALMRGYEEIIQLLLKRIDVKIFADSYSVIMFVATLTGSLSIMKMLLDAGINKDTPFELSLLSDSNLSWVSQDIRERISNWRALQSIERGSILPFELAHTLNYQQLGDFLYTPTFQTVDAEPPPAKCRSLCLEVAKGLRFFESKGAAEYSLGDTNSANSVKNF